MNKPGLDRSSGTPLYRQLAILLEGEIRSGARPPGSRLPAEMALMEDFGVSRDVVRKALEELTKAGMINKRHGAGSFVSLRKIAKPIATLTSYRASMLERGFAPRLDVLANEVVAAPPHVAGWLQVAAGSPVIRLERLASINGEPASILESLLPSPLFQDLLEVDFTEKSLYATMAERYGIQVTRSEAFIEAAIASEREAEIMQTRAGAILMVLEGVVYDQHDRPVEYSRVTHRNDRFKFSIESRASNGPPPSSIES